MTGECEVHRRRQGADRQTADQEFDRRRILGVAQQGIGQA
jgi:hypothetical protein